MKLFEKKPSSVAQIMQSFADTISQLTDLQTAKELEREDELITASLATARAEEAAQEAAQAERVSNNLKALLNQGDTAANADSAPSGATDKVA